MAAAGFLSPYLNGPLPYVRRHITVKIVLNKYSSDSQNRNHAFCTNLLQVLKYIHVAMKYQPRWRGGLAIGHKADGYWDLNPVSTPTQSGFLRTQLAGVTHYTIFSLSLTFCHKQNSPDDNWSVSP